MKKAWSHSNLTSFELCPKKYYATSVAKSVQEPAGEAMTWGKEVHSAFENYMGSGKPFPMGMKHFKKVADPLMVPEGSSAEVLIEAKLALDVNLSPTGFFDRDVWVRCVVDYGVVKGSKALLVDWKTGKRKDDYDQLALMAGVMFAQEPKLQQVDSMFVWLKEKTQKDMIQDVSFTRKDIPDIWNRFLPRVERFQRAFDNDNFPPNPNWLCKRHCPVTSCPYHGT